MDFSKLTRCVDLKGDHVAAAVQSSEAMGALVRRFGELAKPEKGGALILVALARLGTNSCDWIDGELLIELVAEGQKTRIVVSSSIGAGFREAPFPSVLFDVPLSEFARLIAKTPRVIEPLTPSQTADRITLTVTEAIRKTTVPPPMVEIDRGSLVDIPPMPNLPTPVPEESSEQSLAPTKPPPPPKLTPVQGSPKIPRPTPKKP